MDEKALEKVRLEAKMEALTDFATNYFMKNRQTEYDEENYRRIQFEVSIIKKELESISE